MTGIDACFEFTISKSISNSDSRDDLSDMSGESGSAEYDFHFDGDSKIYERFLFPGSMEISTFYDAEIVLLGVCDESKSIAKRRGTSTGPLALRKAFNRSLFFEREGKVIPILPMEGDVTDKLIIDIGNVNRNDLFQVIFDIIYAKKIPIVIGGDHSITTTILHAIGSAIGKVGLIYFDAHPDFVSSRTDYYGSVIFDSLRWIEFDKSLLVGTRSAEKEEIENAKKYGLDRITPIDISQEGIGSISERIALKTDSKKYISIDLDCLDPAFAPGVSVPSAGGLAAADLISLVKSAVKRGIVGMDIVELCPLYDIQEMTSGLASRILFESLASIHYKK